MLRFDSSPDFVLKTWAIGGKGDFDDASLQTQFRPRSWR